MVTRYASRVYVAAVLLVIGVSTANAKYSGGTGEPNDPYQIATAADLMALGETPEDYDKHFIMTADLDLDPNLPARRVFDEAVIGLGWEKPFTGVFDGSGHTISHLTITGGSSLGLFGQLSSTASVSNIGMEDVEISGIESVGGLAGNNSGSITNCYNTGCVSGTGWSVGGLVGTNGGSISMSYSTGTVAGDRNVGGLVGYNGGSVTSSYSSGSVSGTGSVGGLVGSNSGSITDCCSSGFVSGDSDVGGLVGSNNSRIRFRGRIAGSYSTAAVSASKRVGGFVGYNGGLGNNSSITSCYSSGSVSGSDFVGGLVGYNDFWSGVVIKCYSTSAVSGEYVGGLLGSGGGDNVVASFWDIQTSGQTAGDGGTGKTTAEMQTASTFLDAGWDFVGETQNGPNDVWKIVEGLTYPLLSWQKYSGGTGEPNDPYQIATAADLIALGETPEDYDKHFLLTADIDLDPNLPGRRVFDRAVIAPDTNDATWGFERTPFSGVFDGKGHTISHLRITGKDYLGLFGQLGSWDAPACEVKNLGLTDVKVAGSGSYVGGLVGKNWGSIASSYSTGSVSGGWGAGGLAGYNAGSITATYSTASVFGNWYVGGLVGWNNGWRASIVSSYNTGAINGNGDVGGLVGHSGGSIVSSYNTGAVSGNEDVGGLVGYNEDRITTSYNSGAVSGMDYKTSAWRFDYSSSVGGLTGTNDGSITASYSSGPVSGYRWVGGLAGENGGEAALSYSTGRVTGYYSVGGLIGDNDGPRDDRVAGYVSRCYSAGLVVGYEQVGGLVGSNPGRVVESVWDMKTSRLSGSAGGVGLTTGEMMAPYMLGLNGFGNDPNWVLEFGRDYPRLAWENSPGQTIPKTDIDWLEGSGTPEDPYRIDTAGQLVFLGRASTICDKHFVLASDIDLAPNLPYGNVFPQAVIPDFAGVFDGNGHTISHVTIKGASLLEVYSHLGEILRVESEDNGLGGSHLGLFGHVDVGAEVRNLGVVDVKILGTTHIGGLVGRNEGDVAACYCTGAVTGRSYVGGLVGGNQGTVGECYSTGATSGGYSVGGLVGDNFYGGAMSDSYSTGVVTGSDNVGGLVGTNWGGDIVAASFWNTETSGQAASVGGEGKTSAEMQTASTFIDAGWDFVDETANGTEDFWWIDEGRDYPRVWWEHGRVFSPDPWDGARDVPSPLTLQWIGGGAEFCHDVYFGDDEAAVAKATSETQGIYRGRQTVEMVTYNPGTLEWGKTYYWRIDEVNPDDPAGHRKGDVWSFTTAGFIIVSVLDDFESYTDDMNAGQAIFQTWFDGLGCWTDPNDPNTTIPGNGTGSTVGYWSAPFAEQWIVHGGGQSMPTDYNNVSEPWYSEAERTWEMPQDWTIDGGDTVTLYFLAEAINDPEPLYVGIEDSGGRMAVVVHADAEAVLATRWQKWRIALADVQAADVDVAAVRKMVIGVGDRENPIPGGTGRIYIDDIRLTKRMP